MSMSRLNLLSGCLILITLVIGQSILVVNAQQQPKTLVVSTPVDPGTLNSALTTSWAPGAIGAQIYRGLVRHLRNPLMKPVPDLATLWEISPDQTTFTFHLRNNIYWQDGVKFTSADVKYTIEKVVSKYNPNGRDQLSSLVRVDTPDNNTAIILLSKPNPSFMDWAGVQGIGTILPKHVYDGTDPTTNPANTNPIGDGPYVLKEYAKGDRVVLDRNPKYYLDGLPYYDRVVFKVITDGAARTAALEAGEIDYLSYFLSVADADRLKANPKFVVVKYGTEAYAELRYVMFNIRTGPLSDPKVRQAIAYGINRQAISDLATLGYYKPAYSMLHADNWAFLPNASSLLPSYNVQRATQLLDDAGYKTRADGTRFSIRWATEAGVPDAQKSVEVIRDQLGQVGIDVKVEVVERTAIRDRVYNKWDFDAYMAPSSQAGPDPSWMGAILNSRNIVKGLPLSNAMGYNNSRVNTLLDQAIYEPNRQTRTQLYWQIQQAVIRDLPVLPVLEVNQPTAYRKGLVNIPEEWSPWLGPRAGLDFVRENTWPPVVKYETEVGLIATQVTQTTQTQTQTPATATPGLDKIAYIIIAVAILATAALMARRRSRKKP